MDDTTPAGLLAYASGKVWSVTTDHDSARDLQGRYLSSGLSHTNNGITLRLLSPSRPVDPAIAVESTLEEAYLVRMNRAYPVVTQSG